jgi:hypothetical protein
MPAEQLRTADLPRAKIWNRNMADAPRRHRLLLKCQWGVRYEAVVGDYRHEYGGWCAPSTPTDPARQLWPVAWAPIPEFDDVDVE